MQTFFFLLIATVGVGLHENCPFVHQIFEKARLKSSPRRPQETSRQVDYKSAGQMGLDLTVIGLSYIAILSCIYVPTPKPRLFENLMHKQALFVQKG